MELDKRLATIEGRMPSPSNGRSQSFESQLLKGHLSSCVPMGLNEGRKDDLITELSDLFALSRR